MFKGRVLLIIFSIIWFLCGAYFVVKDIPQSLDRGKLSLALNLEGRRDYVLGGDLYSFIKFAEKNISENKTINVVYRGDEFSAQLFYYRVYYYLYPRQFAKNADYFLSYNLSLTEIPDGYKPAAKFDANKYLLIKEGL